MWIDTIQRHLLIVAVAVSGILVVGAFDNSPIEVRQQLMGCNSSSQGAAQPGDKNAGTSRPQASAGQKGVLSKPNPGKLGDLYNVDKKKLGEGSYGTVSKATHKETGSIRAVKTISIAQMKNQSRLQREVDIMSALDHPNIIKLYDSFEDSRAIYLVMEICEGGEMFDAIIEAGHFGEKDAAVLVQQICRAIYYMHENKYCHRDLKPENFLFTKKGPPKGNTPVKDNTLKVIDMGLACTMEKDKQLTTKAGTPYYVSPQVLQGKYNEKCDMWSIGVIMYVLLCGYPPFYGDSDSEVLAKVKLGNFSFNAQDWKGVSEDAKTLIRNLLKMNEADRLSASAALKDTWIVDKAPKAEASTKLPDKFIGSLRGFRSANKLKKMALVNLARNLDEDSIKDLRNLFQQLDGNGDGKLTYAEMKEGMTKAGLKEMPAEMDEILQGIDSDGSGEIDYTEFLAATVERHALMKDTALWNAFKAFDKNGDNKIDKTEISNVLKTDDIADSVWQTELNAIFAEVDTDGSGQIDFEEFKVLMQGRGKQTKE